MDAEARFTRLFAEARALTRTSTGPTDECLDDEQLAYYAARCLPEREYLRAARHSATCTFCFRRLNELRVGLAETSLEMRRASGFSTVVEGVADSVALLVKSIGDLVFEPFATCQYEVGEPQFAAAAVTGRRETSPGASQGTVFSTSDGYQVEVAPVRSGDRIDLHVTVREDDTLEPVRALSVSMTLKNQVKVQAAETDEGGRVSFVCRIGDEYVISVGLPAER